MKKNNKDLENVLGVFLSSRNNEPEYIEIYPIEKGKMPIKLYSTLYNNAYQGEYLN